MPWLEPSNSTRTRSQDPPRPNGGKLQRQWPTKPCGRRRPLARRGGGRLGLGAISRVASSAVSRGLDQTPLDVSGNLDPLQLYAETRQLPSVAHKRHGHEGREQVEPYSDPPSTAPLASSEHNVGALRMSVAGSDVPKPLESVDLADTSTGHVICMDASSQAQPPGAAEESGQTCAGFGTS